MRRQTSALVVAAMLVAACSPSQPPSTAAPGAAPAAPATAPAADAQQAKSLELYRTLRKEQQWELAAPIGKEVVDKWPGSGAAKEVQETLADTTAKAAAITKAMNARMVSPSLQRCHDDSEPPLDCNDVSVLGAL